MLGTWCVVFDVWCLVLGDWCLVYGACCLAYGVWCLVLIMFDCFWLCLDVFRFAIVLLCVCMFWCLVFAGVLQSVVFVVFLLPGVLECFVLFLHHGAQ